MQEPIKTSVEKPEVATLSSSPGENRLADLIGRIDDEILTTGDLAPILIDNPLVDSADQLSASNSVQYIRFILEDLVCGLPMINAVEISHLVEWVQLPNVPPWLLGVGNLRGEIISIVDLRLFFNLPGMGMNRGEHIIVTQYGDMVAGFMVDRIQGMFSFNPESAVQQQKSTETGTIVHYVSGAFALDDDIIHILDCEKLYAAIRTI
ncbi:MAG: purine-binding chemotaxis protein CheW [Desulfobacteraceae bacterium]|nr:purine-binding chemotaxis protein CheW [Desulfobacteraceae bacterium]